MIFYVIPVKTGIQKNYSRPEFISGYLELDAANLFSMTKKSLDSRFHGNDIEKHASNALYILEFREKK
ncbi:MAG: hypothetical protein LN573_04105 [Rickettsia endosymbiont of Oxypoda opaca]|nr:hypothetical protein [Rickettsia endosymbiont of Oxypoda opaca]